MQQQVHLQAEFKKLKKSIKRFAQGLNLVSSQATIIIGSDAYTLFAYFAYKWPLKSLSPTSFRYLGAGSLLCLLKF